MSFKFFEYLYLKFYKFRIKLAIKIYLFGKIKSKDIRLNVKTKFVLKSYLIRMLLLDQGLYAKTNSLKRFQSKTDNFNSYSKIILIDGQCLKTNTFFRGIGRYTLRLAKHLALINQKWVVVIIVPNFGNSGNLPKLAKYIHDSKISNLKLKIIDIFQQEEVLVGLNASQKFTLEIKKLQANFLIIPSFFEHPMDAIPINLKEIGETRSGVVIHDLIPLHFSELLPTPILKQMYLSKLETLIFADQVFTVSKFTASCLQSHLKNLASEKIKVVGASGFFEINKSNSSLKNKVGILCIGADTSHKNIHRLIEAYSRLDSKIRKSHSLTICGLTPNMKFTYQNEFPAIAKLIRMPNRISDSRLENLYKNSRVVVVPSLMEGFGMPAVEAWQVGTVAIGGEQTVFQELMNSRRVLFDPKDIASITKILTELLSNDQLWFKVRREAVNRLPIYQWNRVAKNYSKCIEV